jgi:Zn-dependent protease
MLLAQPDRREYALDMLGAVNFSNPLFWAVFIGWMLSVVLHEFAHGLVAYLGGDYTIRERGGLSLNPIQYVDPFVSFVLPLLFMLWGGVPLPGGVTYIRRDLLRSRLWSSAVSAAGPAMNFLLFLLLGLSLNPHLGWVHPHDTVLDWSPAQRFVAALAILQLFSVLLNLIPIPPLDGFQILSPFLDKKLESQLSRVPVAMGLLVLLFIMMSSERFRDLAENVMAPITGLLGLRFDQLRTAYNIVFFNHA